jgi:hypothetical protein
MATKHLGQPLKTAEKRADADGRKRIGPHRWPPCHRHPYTPCRNPVANGGVILSLVKGLFRDRDRSKKSDSGAISRGPALNLADPAQIAVCSRPIPAINAPGGAQQSMEGSSSRCLGGRRE